MLNTGEKKKSMIQGSNPQKLPEFFLLKKQTNKKGT